MSPDTHSTIAPLLGKRIAIIGFGSQGQAQALNLRDRRLNVVIGLRKKSPSRRKALDDGLIVMDTIRAVRSAQVVISLVPDELQCGLLCSEILPNLSEGTYLGFAHGLAIRFGDVRVPDGINIFMAAPRGPGDLIRRNFLNGHGCACTIAVEQDPSGDTHDIARAYATAIGAFGGGVVETSFAEECEADLFGEQAVLCGGLVELIRAAYETLTEAGVNPTIAYLECVHEAKLVVDLIYERGVAGMRQAISTTARFGGLTRGPRVVGSATREALRDILAEIRDGRFTQELTADDASDRLVSLQRREAQHPMEKVGTQVRRMLFGDDQPDQGGPAA